jgi:hypothetical protein
MRNRFTRGFCVLAASAAITTTLGLSAAGVASASSGPGIRNATSVCGSLCFDLSNEQLGTNSIQNAHGGATGTSINLRRAGNLKVNEDFEVGFVGFLGEFCPNDGGNGEIPSTSYVCVNYPAFWDVFQAKFSPDSNQSGQCVGVTAASVSQRVSLVPCRGVDGSTFWVGDAINQLGGDCRTAGNYCPWVNGADQATSDPLVLTVNTGSEHPTNVLRVNPELGSGGSIPDIQQFTTEPGPAF